MIYIKRRRVDSADRRFVEQLHSSYSLRTHIADSVLLARAQAVAERISNASGSISPKMSGRGVTTTITTTTNVETTAILQDPPGTAFGWPTL